MKVGFKFSMQLSDGAFKCKVHDGIVWFLPPLRGKVRMGGTVKDQAKHLRSNMPPPASILPRKGGGREQGRQPLVTRHEPNASILYIWSYFL